MRISDLPFRTNIKIPERREDGTYELADYTLGYFGVGTAGLIRKDIYDNRVWIGNSAEYAGSDLDNRMTDIYDSYPDELKELIIPSTFSLYNGSGVEDITRKVFAPTLTMIGLGDNHGVEEGFTWPIFTDQNSRIKTFNGFESNWWLSSQYSSDDDWFVRTDGSAKNIRSYIDFGAVPAFAIPQSVQIDDTPDKDGSCRLTVLNSGKYLYGAELSKAIREELKRQGIKGVSVSCKTFTGGQRITVKVKAVADDFAKATGDRYSEAFRSKLSRINAVLDTYNYDNSNCMFGFFDTNFDRTIKVVAE